MEFIFLLKPQIPSFPKLVVHQLNYVCKSLTCQCGDRNELCQCKKANLQIGPQQGVSVWNAGEEPKHISAKQNWAKTQIDVKLI